MKLVQIIQQNKNNVMKCQDVKIVQKDKDVGHKIIIIFILFNHMELYKEYKI